MFGISSKITLAGLMSGALVLGGCATQDAVDHAQAAADAAQHSADAAAAAAQAAAGGAQRAQSTADTAVSGLSTTQAQVAMNAQRIGDVGQFVAVSRTNVLFSSGSARVSAKGQQDLLAMAAQAKALPAYRLVIVGRADTTGDSRSNQRLSVARADAVTNYLLHSSGVLPTNILPITGLGDQTVADDPNPPATPEEARRVTVTIVVSKSSQTS
jgi:outer membrane protein OmpA-like peptidoglycan-associated protein